MTRNGYGLAAGLVASACGNSSESSTTVTETVSASTTSTMAAPTATTSAAAAPTTASADLPSLILTPANSQRTDGPESIQEGAVHKHFLVSGSPTDAMDGYKTALEGSCAWPSKPSNTNCGSDN